MENTHRTATRRPAPVEELRVVGSEIHWYMDGVFFDVCEFLPLTSGTQLRPWTR